MLEKRPREGFTVLQEVDLQGEGAARSASLRLTGGGGARRGAALEAVCCQNNESVTTPLMTKAEQRVCDDAPDDKG